MKGFRALTSAMMLACQAGYADACRAAGGSAGGGPGLPRSPLRAALRRAASQTIRLAHSPAAPSARVGGLSENSTLPPAGSACQGGRAGQKTSAAARAARKPHRRTEAA